MSNFTLNEFYDENKIIFFQGGYNIEKNMVDGIEYGAKAMGKLDRLIFAIQSFFSCFIPCYSVSNLKINLINDDGTSESHFYLAQTKSIDAFMQKGFKAGCEVIDHICLSGREITIQSA